MKGNAKVCWGILGAGDVAEVKSGPALQKCANSHLAAVMRRNRKKAEDFARRHEVPRWYDKVEDLLKDKEINAIYVASPPHTHLEYALKALQAGKNVYLEKPMTLNVEEAKQLEEAVAASDKKLTVAHYRRKLPAFLKVKELLETQEIGELRFAKIEIFQPLKTDLIAQTEENWRVKPEISGGGYFHDIAPHQLDLMCLYFGRIEKSTGFSKNQAADYIAADIVNGIISFKSGVQVQGLWCFNASPGQETDRCKIYGSKGSIEFSFYGGNVQVEKVSGNQEFRFESWKHVQQPMIQATVNYFLDKTENPCSVEEAHQVMKLLESMSQ